MRNIIFERIKENFSEVFSEQILLTLTDTIYASDTNLPTVNGTIIPMIRKRLNTINRSNPTPEAQLTLTLTALKEIIDKIPLAEKQICNNSKLQRRMDSLSRILSVGGRLTPCIAVAFIAGNLYITSNTPTALLILQETVEKKLVLLRKFIIENKNMDFKQKAFNCAIDIMWLGTGVKRHEKRSVLERLEMDLIKVANFCFSKEGFNSLQCLALRESKPIFRFPDTKLEETKRTKIHAEQQMLLVIQDIIKDNKKEGLSGKGSEAIAIGINKLACGACAAVLGKHPDLVQHRGTSNVTFARTFNILSRTNHPPTTCVQTIKTSLYPEDSDSDPEFEVMDEQEKNKKITAYPSQFFLHACKSERQQFEKDSFKAQRKFSV